MTAHAPMTDAERRARRERVHDALRAYGPLSCTELCERVGMTQGPVLRALQQLDRMGRARLDRLPRDRREWRAT
jgi:DNA-binding MarR family transcriptional regulator